MITLYSTGCPKCSILRKKLDAKHVQYTLVDDSETMLSMGIDAVPVLGVDGKLLNFKESVNWINTQKG